MYEKTYPARFHSFRTHSRQRGAALVVGLLLLAIITLLAVAGMNSASVELVLAGNTQVQAKAFQASEQGIEQQMVVGKFLPGGPEENPDNGSAAGSTTESSTAYSTRMTSDLDGAPQPAIWGNDLTSFSTYHFQISSVGTSQRGTTTTHLQGVAVLAPFSPSFGGSGGLTP
ncbi:MAG: PilX N-terminal domain-containing pilus assembly protein [Gammaproteobacteria bacterium]